MRIPIAALLTVAALAVSARDIRVLVWDERQPEQKQAYSNFLGNAIAEHLRSAGGFSVRSVGLDDPEQGLTADVLDDTDVIVWWAHKRSRDVKPEKTRAVVERLLAGRLSLLALHSAHWAPPFVEAMNERTRSDARKRFATELARGVPLFEEPARLYSVPKRTDALTPSSALEKGSNGTEVVKVRLPLCVFPAWRNDGQPSHVATLLPDHPIAKGVPAAFDIPQTEMYADPFHVPAPDAVVFEETWDKGERFRSGSVWQVGEGRVVYFRPGHETYPIFRQEIPLRIVENTVRFLGRP